METATTKQSLEKLSPYEKRVITLLEEVKDLKVTEVKDTKGLKAVHEGRMALKNLRVEIDGTRKELIAPALQWQRQVNDKAKDLTNKIKPVEDSLKDQEDYIKAEKKRIAEEKERQRLRILHERGGFIIRNGGKCEGDLYFLPFSGDTIGEQDLVEMDADDWAVMSQDIDQRVKREQGINQWIQDLTIRHRFHFDEALPGWVLDFKSGIEKVTKEEIESAVDDASKAIALKDRVLSAVDALKLHEKKEREEAEHLRRQLEERELKEAEQAKRERELKEKIDKLESEKKPPTQDPEEEPQEAPQEAPEEYSGPFTKMDDDLVRQIRSLCQKIVSKPFLKAQLPEAENILKQL